MRAVSEMSNQPWLVHTVQTDSMPPTRVSREWVEGDFSSHLSGILKCPLSLPSSLHHHQIYFSSLFMHGPCLPFCSNFLHFPFSFWFLWICWFFPLANSCAHHPTHSVRFSFFRKGILSGTRRSMPWHDCTYRCGGSYLLDGGIHHTVKTTSMVPKNVKQ